MSKRRLAWTTEVSRMRSERAARPEIREEALKTKPSPLLGLSCWRGRSGRRYVVGVHTLDRALEEKPGAVLIGVRRPDEGPARIVGLGWRGTTAEAIALARADGATEIHVHRLADTDEERDAIVEDLVGDDAA